MFNGKDIMEIGFEKNGQKYIFKQVDVTGMDAYERNAIRMELQKQMESYLLSIAGNPQPGISPTDYENLESEIQSLRRANEHIKEENMDLRIKVDVLKELLKESYRYGQD